MWDSDKLQNAQSKRSKDKGKNVFIKQEKRYIMHTNRISFKKKKKKLKKELQENPSC